MLWRGSRTAWLEQGKTLRGYRGVCVKKKVVNSCFLCSFNVAIAAAGVARSAITPKKNAMLEQQLQAVMQRDTLLEGQLRAMQQEPVPMVQQPQAPQMSVAIDTKFPGYPKNIHAVVCGGTRGKIAGSLRPRSSQMQK
eukprot:4923195-Amphidinium_carterae.1